MKDFIYAVSFLAIVISIAFGIMPAISDFAGKLTKYNKYHTLIMGSVIVILIVFSIYAAGFYREILF